jgi:hypothetical protein
MAFNEGEVPTIFDVISLSLVVWWKCSKCNGSKQNLWWKYVPCNTKRYHHKFFIYLPNLTFANV